MRKLNDNKRNATVNINQPLVPGHLSTLRETFVTSHRLMLAHTLALNMYMPPSSSSSPSQ